MKSQQIAVYQSLKDFMLAIGYANASEQREDDPVWSTLNDNNFKAMMEYKFGVEPRFIVIPTKLEAVHEGITSHEAWAYHEDLERDDDEGAPVPINVAATPAEGNAPEDTGSAEANLNTEPPVDGGPDNGEGTGEPASTVQEPEGGQQPAAPEGEQAPQEPAQQPEAPAQEQAPATEEKPEQEGDSDKE